MVNSTTLLFDNSIETCGGTKHLKRFNFVQSELFKWPTEHKHLPALVRYRSFRSKKYIIQPSRLKILTNISCMCLNRFSKTSRQNVTWNLWHRYPWRYYGLPVSSEKSKKIASIALTSATSDSSVSNDKENGSIEASICWSGMITRPISCCISHVAVVMEEWPRFCRLRLVSKEAK